MDLADQTRKILSTLTPREEKVLRMRFGISDRPGTLGEEESAPLDLIETFINEPEIIEAPAPEKMKSLSKKRAAK
jgi:RNA polymerase primary sigma factor